MRRGLLTYLLLLCCTVVMGRSHEESIKKFTFGAECTYSATLYSFEYHYFKNNDGAREEIVSGSFLYDSDSEFALHCGYNFNNYWNLSLYAGYTGIGKFHKAVPISVRATRYFGENPLKDRWFTFIDLGSGLSVKSYPEEIITGKIGGGYRLSLSRRTKIDFLLSVRAVHTHPDISIYDHAAVRENIYTNSGVVTSLTLGIGITF